LRYENLLLVVNKIATTQVNLKQNKKPGVVLISVRKTTPHHATPHHTTTPGIITIWAVLGNLGSRQAGKQPYSNQTKRNIEDDLNIFENGRQPQLPLKEDDLNFWEMKDNLKK
jgi:hypothetical protein